MNQQVDWVRVLLLRDCTTKARVVKCKELEKKNRVKRTQKIVAHNAPKHDMAAGEGRRNTHIHVNNSIIKLIYQ